MNEGFSAAQQEIISQLQQDPNFTSLRNVLLGSLPDGKTALAQTEDVRASVEGLIEQLASSSQTELSETDLQNVTNLLMQTLLSSAS